MALLSKRLPSSLGLALLVVCAVAAGAATVGFVNTTSSDAICQGNSCLPVGGYTLDTSFECGSILIDSCYANGTRIAGNAVFHHFGWGSSSYNGAGSASVGLEVGNGSYSVFGGTGTNLIRACYYDSCVPQGVFNGYLRVFNSGSNAHTIWGHGKA